MTYKRFTNHACEYYPCHKNKTGKINCLFCFCPLYSFDSCPGEFILLDSGVKDCSDCEWIHTDEAYDQVVEILTLVSEDNKNVGNN